MLARHGVDTLVDGAHALGMVPLDLRALGAAYYTANCHKWLCAPKGAAFLHVRRDKQAAIRPLVISHGANAPLNGRSRYQIEFDWTGTGDPTPYLCVPEAIRVVGSLIPGGWPAIMARNHALAVAGRAALCSALAMPAPCPETMLGTMATISLPGDGPADRTLLDPLQVALFEQHGIEVPISLWPAPPRRTLRISAHLYNQPEEYAELAAVLAKLLAL
jgi:isopenicillin-N epimerase